LPRLIVWRGWSPAVPGLSLNDEVTVDSVLLARRRPSVSTSGRRAATTRFPR
jgi:hypothetical protein